MNTYAFILGRKHLLSVAEIASVFENQAHIIDIQPESLVANFENPLAKPQDSLNRLGGTVKIVEIFLEVPLNESNFDSVIIDFIADKYGTKETKLSYGVSVHNIPQKREIFLKKLLINIKKGLKKEGLKSRFINKNFQNPKTAAIIGEKLLKEGSEIVIINGKHKVFIGETKAIQDIESYSERDYDRPARDPKLGMLPPKLAQIMINLAGLKNEETTIYDPFCGIGTVLTEGLLLDHSVVGSDINPEVIEKSKQNISWLKEKYPSISQDFRLFQKDAATITKKDIPENLDAIITESYLGPPLRKVPDPKYIKKTFDHIDELLYRFFRSLHPLVKKDTPIIISIPVYRDKQHFHFIKSLPEKIIKLGYKVEPLIPHQLSSKFNLRIHERESLIYDRPDQTVGREIWKFIRN